MKIRAYTLTIILCVLFAFFMTSCRDDSSTPFETGAATDTTAAAVTEAETTAPVTKEEPDETEPVIEEPDESVRIPIENDKALEFIEHQYSKATEIIDWVKNGTLNTDLNSEIVTGDGNIYFPVDDKEERAELDGASIASFDDLSAYIKSIFARSIADDLIDLAKEHYTDIDGVLCLEAKYTDTEPYVEIPEETDEETESAEEEEIAQPKVVSTEFFLSKFTDTLFRYTAKVIYETVESDDGIPSEQTENAEYFDFIFENTGSGWYFTAFPELPR